MRSLLNNLSTVQIALLFLVTASGLAVVGVIVAERLFPRLREGSFYEAKTAIEFAYSLLYTFILALTISGLSSNTNAANTSIADESTVLAQMTRVSAGIKPEGRVPLRAAIDQYTHAVAEDEFATMRNGQPSPIAAVALANLYGVYQGYKPSSSEAAAHGASLSRIDQVTQLRRKRLQVSGQSLSPLHMTMLLLGAIVFIAVCYPAKIKKKVARVATIGAIAAFVGFVFVLAVVLNHPFSGDLAASNQPYKEAALATYWPGI